MKFTTCFGVTDHHVIIPLKVIGRTVVEEFTEIETEIDGDSNEYMTCHYKHYFKVMWLDDDGFPDKANVFVTKATAIAYALKNANAEMKLKQEAVNHLNQQVVELKEELRCEKKW